MAHFRLPAGQVSQAVRHRTVEEIWYVLSGNGEMWQSDGSQEALTALAPGVCLTIPVSVSFQFRSTGTEPLAAVAITMPPWPGDAEADRVDGKWTPTNDRPE
jgi:mannose-6-phosphate isomerase-like protein (cupin superfamily)